jgi:hypothetical protein
MSDNLNDLRRQFFEKADDLRRLADDLAALRDLAFPVGSEIRLARCPQRKSYVELHWPERVEFPLSITGGAGDGWREGADLLTADRLIAPARDPLDE